MNVEQELNQFVTEITEMQQDFDAKCARLRLLAIKAADEQRLLRSKRRTPT